MLGIGVDVGGTSIKSALIEIGDPARPETYSILKFQSIPTEAANGRDAVVANIIKSIERFDWRSCEYIAVASAGTIDWDSGTVTFATDTLKGYTGLELSKILSEKFGRRVIAINDAVGALVAEAFIGAGRRANSIMMFTIGTGLGVSFLKDKMLDSSSVVDTRMGHFKLYPDGRKCTCGECGCAEQYVSATALKRYGNENLYHLFRANDAVSKNVMSKFYKDFSTVIAEAVKRYSPDMVIVGGGVIEMAEYWWQNFLKEYKIRSEAPIACAGLGNKAGVLGSVYAMANGKFDRQ